jgi:hypothetical protein
MDNQFGVNWPWSYHQNTIERAQAVEGFQKLCLYIHESYGERM